MNECPVDIQSRDRPAPQSRQILVRQPRKDTQKGVFFVQLYQDLIVHSSFKKRSRKAPFFLTKEIYKYSEYLLYSVPLQYLRESPKKGHRLPFYP